MTSELRGPGPAVSLAEATRVWARIGLLSFGGPAGQIALMHRVLVEERGWISERQFLHALNFCMLLPGPEAQQLATYVGWQLHRVRGGLIAGSLFVLPGFLVILALSYLYVAAGSLPVVQGLFLGLKAAVIAIVLQALVRIARRSLHGPLPVVVALAAFLAMYAWQVPFPWVIAVAALAGALAPRFRPAADDTAHEDLAASAGWRGLVRTVAIFGLAWLLPVAALLATLGPGHVFSTIATFFSKMAVVTFGGAYAVLAYVSQEAVQTYQWLMPGEMIDGLAMAETTPGPLIMVVQFVGFLAAYRDPGGLHPGVAGLLGALVTTWVTFAPCFLWIFAGAPYIERLRNNRWLAGALAGVTAAVIGVIMNLAAWFATHALFETVVVVERFGAAIEWPVLSSLRTAPFVILLLALGMVFRWKASLQLVLAVSGALGIAAHALLPQL